MLSSRLRPPQRPASSACLARGLLLLQVRWCRDNFVNVRSMRKALDIYEQLHGHLEALQVGWGWPQKPELS